MSDAPTLAKLISQAAGDRWIADARQRVCLSALAADSGLDQPAERLRGQSVLIATTHQLPAIRAALALDGVARRLLLAPPDLDPAWLTDILRDGEVNAIVAESRGGQQGGQLDVTPVDSRRPAAESGATEWVLFTSGTTGRPKLVVHTLASLTGPLAPARPDGAVWSTFYDVRRYGGISILLRALQAGNLVLSAVGEPPGAFLTRAAAAGVTHLTGTPSHWRRALMTPQIEAIAPSYVRLSGEIADQPILDRLRQRFPAARIVHAFATTEAGLAFEVGDGQAGFPAALFTRHGAAELRLADGALLIRSARTATHYLGDAPKLRDADGWVDTGDIVTCESGEIGQSGRAHFAGRRGGVINVGGQKVYPEEVEAVIARHPAVRVCRVHPRRSPVTGAIVAAELVLHASASGGFPAIQAEILAACRAALAAHKVPVSLRQVETLPIAASGKLQRVPADA